jgi:ribonuclease J
MASGADELVFIPLGGVGEIGMNAYLYGFGPKQKRKWLMVDCGVSFAGDDLPGIDLIIPEVRFLEERRGDLVGIIITHAHEDHIGALIDLWPRLKAPVYATQFAADLLNVRRMQEQGAPKIPITVVDRGTRLKLGPFDVEFVAVAHSIPESTALAIRTPAGTVLHTGDWKIDPSPGVSWTTDEKRLAEIGDEGVLALVCDSTNVIRGGESPSEKDVAATLIDLVATAKGRVAVTTFASNVARIRAVAEAAQANGRQVVAIGRAMDRVIQVATELGYLDGLPPFRGSDAYGYLPRDKVVALLTGSQGEPRAALARVAEDQHPDVALAPGDRVILSSRTIPGQREGGGATSSTISSSQGVEDHHRPRRIWCTSPAIRGAARWSRCTTGCGRRSPFPSTARPITWPNMRRWRGAWASRRSSSPMTATSSASPPASRMWSTPCRPSVCSRTARC